jgi:hypothetical protein
MEDNSKKPENEKIETAVPKKKGIKLQSLVVIIGMAIFVGSILFSLNRTNQGLGTVAKAVNRIDSTMAKNNGNLITAVKEIISDSASTLRTEVNNKIETFSGQANKANKNANDAVYQVNLLKKQYKGLHKEVTVLRDSITNIWVFNNNKTIHVNDTNNQKPIVVKKATSGGGDDEEEDEPEEDEPEE